MTAISVIFIWEREMFFSGPEPEFLSVFLKMFPAENMGGFKPDKRTLTKVKSAFLLVFGQKKSLFKKKKNFQILLQKMDAFFPEIGRHFCFEY